MNLEGYSKYQIKKIILEDGKEIDLDNISHVLICKEADSKHNISHKIIKKEDTKLFSNTCYALSNAFRFMDINKELPFDQALSMHIDYINSIKKQR